MIVRKFSDLSLSGLSITIFINLKAVHFLDITRWQTFSERATILIWWWISLQDLNPDWFRILVVKKYSRKQFLTTRWNWTEVGITTSCRTTPPTHPPVRKRGSRRIPWFNPPYSLDMETNVAKDFLELVDKHFPPGLIIYSICNRSTQKISYRRLPNLTSVIGKHNSKLWRAVPMSNANQEPAATARISRNVRSLGSATKMEPYTRHRSLQLGEGWRHVLVKQRTSKDGIQSTRKICWTRLPLEIPAFLNNIGERKNAGTDPKVTWTFFERDVPVFNPVTSKCSLCIQ
jgi:hypothetical protein